MPTRTQKRTHQHGLRFETSRNPVDMTAGCTYLCRFSGNSQLFLAFDRPEVSECAKTLPLFESSVGSPMYRVSEGVRSTHGQDGAIVLDIRQGQMFNLNLVGSRILELLETGAAESAIVDEIIQKFEVSRAIAEGDVREFIESLKQHHVLEDSELDSLR